MISMIGVVTIYCTGQLTPANREGAGPMPEEPPAYRLYADLAGWWPLISPPQEYPHEAALAGGLFGWATGPVRTVLDLGSGGGGVASHLARRYTLTLVDLSPAMLAVSQRLNPGCEHLLGDMRTVRLGREFDAVLVHDAVGYMTTEDSLAQVIATAYAHCRPGGVAVFMPDHLAGTFRPDTGCGGTDSPDGRGARFLSWSWDPDPADTWMRTDYAYLLREADGTVSAVQETHRLGLFGRDTWLRLLAEAGFGVQPVTEDSTEDPPRE